jgi:hypothetical protein
VVVSAYVGMDRWMLPSPKYVMTATLSTEMGARMPAESKQGGSAIYYPMAHLDAPAFVEMQHCSHT